MRAHRSIRLPGSRIGYRNASTGRPRNILLTTAKVAGIAGVAGYAGFAIARQVVAPLPVPATSSLPVAELERIGMSVQDSTDDSV